MLEGYTTLGFLAAHTSTVDLQLLVTGVTYRHPGLLAKIVTTLDVLSGGRAVLGLGAAWYQQEHEALGVRFPPVAERFERLEETLQIVHAMFDGTEAPYDGKHYRLGEHRQPPRAGAAGRRSWSAARGERKTLRLVAKYADACNIFANADGGPARCSRSWTCCAATATARARLRRDRQDDPVVGRLDPSDAPASRAGGFAESA